MARKITIFVIIFILLSTAGRFTSGQLFGSAGSDLRFKHVFLEEGLSQSSITCIARDNTGFMWFGTRDGLNRYNGDTFTVFKHNPDNPNSISGDFIRALYFDPAESTLWIGTRTGGLNKYDSREESFFHYQHNASKPGSLSGEEVCAIFKDSRGELWVGTWGAGLNRFIPSSGTFEHFQHDHLNPGTISSDVVRAIFEDKDGVLWIGTYGGGLNRFDRENNRFHHIRFNESQCSGSGENDNIMHITQTRDGKLWISTDFQGLVQYDPKTGQCKRFRHTRGKPGSLSHDRVRVVMEDRGGRLWIGTYGGGVNIYDFGTGTFRTYRKELHNFYSLNSDEILALYEDRFDIIWLGTNSGGINKYDRKLKRFRHYSYIPDEPNSLNEPKVRSIYEDKDGILWIGTNGGGLNRLDRRTGKYTHYKHNSDDPDSINFDKVYALHPGKNDDILWVGTYGGGLDKFNKKTGTFKHYTHDPSNPNSISFNRIRRIAVDREGMLWIGTWNGGLNRFDPVSERFTRYRHDPDKPGSISLDYILTVFMDRDGVLWVGTWGGGIDVYDRANDRFINYKHQLQEPNSLNNNKVHCIYQDSKGLFWFGTDKGFSEFDPGQKKWRSFTSADGLANDIVYSILEDRDANLWLSTNKGLSRFNRDTRVFKNYGVEDGLRNTEYNGGAYFKNSKGELFFGGLNGMNSFFPADIVDNPFVPPVIITDFKIFNRSVTFDKPLSKVKEINLSSEENYFSINFVALNYRSPENNRYAYKLEGFDKEWIYCGNRKTVTYTNIDGGTYNFRVKGSNNDGVWNDKGASIVIVISPPFWKTWWFRLLILILALCLIAMGYHFRLIASRRKNVELQELNVRLKEQITERKQVEAALQASEEKFRKIFENSVDVHYRADLDGKLLMISPSGRHLLGYRNVQDMIGKKIAETFYKNPQERMLFNSTLKKYGKVTHFEVHLKQRNGEPVIVETSARMVYDKNGRPEAVEGTMRDITLRKRAEEESYRLQNQLISAKKMEAVGTLAGGMAHEFNNLIAVINGNAQMLLDMEDRRSFSHKKLKSIVNAGERCAALTNRLLSFSRKQMLKLKQLNLNDLVTDIEDTIRRTIGDKIELETAFDSIPGDINVDSELMIQVIMGMINNAHDAMPQGGTLTIKTRTLNLDTEKIEVNDSNYKHYKGTIPTNPDLALEGKYVCLTIADTGIGMNEETLQNIFDPFFTTKQVGKGIGLDLSFVYGTVSQHNGWIDVKSSPGKGSEFNVYLPLFEHTSTGDGEEKNGSSKENTRDFLLEDDAG